jgi:hypothetical protein
MNKVRGHTLDLKFYNKVIVPTNIMIEQWNGIQSPEIKLWPTNFQQGCQDHSLRERTVSFISLSNGPGTTGYPHTE